LQGRSKRGWWHRWQQRHNERRRRGGGGKKKWKQGKGLIFFFQTLASDFFSISLFAIFILLFYLYFGKK
jgi:hypothetical protein